MSDVVSLCEQAWNIVIPSIEHALDAGVLARPFAGTLVVVDSDDMIGEDSVDDPRVDNRMILFQEQFDNRAEAASRYDAVALAAALEDLESIRCDHCSSIIIIDTDAFVAVFRSSAPAVFNESITDSIRSWIRALDKSRS